MLMRSRCGKALGVSEGLEDLYRVDEVKDEQLKMGISSLKRQLYPGAGKDIGFWTRWEALGFELSDGPDDDEERATS